jgi:hypothetical protein
LQLSLLLEAAPDLRDPLLVHVQVSLVLKMLVTLKNLIWLTGYFYKTYDQEDPV